MAARRFPSPAESEIALDAPRRPNPSRRRALQSVFLRAVSKTIRRPIRVRTRTVWGETMTVELPEPISIAIFENGYIEEGLTSALQQELRPGMVLFDVGAHIGYYSLLASRLVGPSGKVVAFEPTPRTRSILERNAAGRSNTVIEPRAVWSHETTISFNDFGWRFSALNSAFTPRSRPDENVSLSSTYEVDTTSLDTYVERTGIAPDFVKIDAESAEHEVLRGMDELLREVRPLLSVEVGDVATAAPKTRAVLAYAMSKGYEPAEYREGRLVAHELRSSYAHGNLLLIPRERGEAIRRRPRRP